MFKITIQLIFSIAKDMETYSMRLPLGVTAGKGCRKIIYQRILLRNLSIQLPGNDPPLDVSALFGCWQYNDFETIRTRSRRNHNAHGIGQGSI